MTTPIMVPYIARGTGVEARQTPWDTALATIQRHIAPITTREVATFQSRIQDTLEDGLVRHLPTTCKRFIADTLLERWWLHDAYAELPPVGHLAVHSGMNKHYIPGYGWVWFVIEAATFAEWDIEGPVSNALEYRPTEDGIVFLPPRPDPWSGRFTDCLRPEGGLHANPRVSDGFLIGHGATPWGELNTLSVRAFLDLTGCDPADLWQFYYTYRQRRWGLGAEWQRLSHKWLSVLGEEWLSRYDHERSRQSMLTSPDCHWLAGYRLALVLMGGDRLALLLDIQPDAIYLALMHTLFYLASADGTDRLLDLTPYGRLWTIHRVLGKAVEWFAPLGDPRHPKVLTGFIQLEQQMEVERIHETTSYPDKTPVAETLAAFDAFMNTMALPSPSEAETA